MRTRDFAFLAATLLVGMAAAMLAARGAWGVASEWQWPHRGPGDIAWARWWRPTLPSLALIAFSLWLLRRARRSARVCAAWVLLFVLLAFALQLSVLEMHPASTAFAGAVILSPVATTYFGEAGNIRDMAQFLREYAYHMRAFSQHAQTYPPGPIIFFWAVRRAVAHSPGLLDAASSFIAAYTGMEPAEIAGAYARLYGRPVPIAEAVAAVLAAWLLGLLGCLSIIPVFLLARERGGATAAVCAAALAGAVPSLLLFTPSIVQLVTLETMLALYLFHLGWSRRRPGWGAAAGAMWALAALTSLAVLVLPLLLAAWAAMAQLAGGGRSGEPRPRPAWRVAGAWLTAAVAVFAVAHAAAGIDFPAIVRSALGAHREVTTQAFARTYWRWLGWNLFDFWMFLGAGLGLWLLCQMWGEARALARGERAQITPLLWALAFTLIALDLSGVVRAEAGRIWMFLMLPATVAAGGFVAVGRRPEWSLATLLAAQMLQIAVFERHLALFVVL
ncbi:MAG TPA: hypothetical protein VM221_13430 [Armatimonadota bacterium]|nr:hypothetical protein [Armatimonadota bacterium]